MVTKEKFSEYFGFLDLEVDRLFEIYRQISGNAKFTRESLAEWYVAVGISYDRKTKEHFCKVEVIG